MTQEADGSYFGPKHLKQTTLHYSQFIENGQAKLGQHYMDWVMQSIIVMQNDFSQPLHIHSYLFLLGLILNILMDHEPIF